MRTHFGRHYFGVPSAIVLIGLPMWSLLWPEHDPAALLVFWLLFIVMQLRARIESMVMIARGDIVHTRYNGHPRLARLLKRVPQEKIKSHIEPLIAIVLGVALLELSPPLGSYLIAAGCALAAVGQVIESVSRARALQLHDVWLEQRDAADAFRRFQQGRH